MLDTHSAPTEVLEHILAAEYGWSLEYIEKLSPKKFQSHVMCCLIKKRIDILHAKGSL
jgi:hypothetical protein